MFKLWNLWKPKRSWGMLVLGVWLVAQGLVPLLGIQAPYLGTVLAVLAVLAIVAGILILLGR